jgi:hypothetical protein
VLHQYDGYTHQETSRYGDSLLDVRALVVMMLFFRYRDDAAVRHFTHFMFELDGGVADVEIVL